MDMAGGRARACVCVCGDGKHLLKNVLFTKNCNKFVLINVSYLPNIELPIEQSI